MRRPMDGLVLADKPAGKTSHDLVALVRRGLGERRAGHAGTLDPFATGLLLVLVGRGHARIQRFVMALPKTYEAVARFGAVSTTGDPEGEITPTGVRPAGAAPAAHRAAAPAPARLQRRPRRRPARLRARARRGGGRAPRARGRRRTASSSSGARATAPACSSSARRGPTSAPSSPTSATPTAEELRRTAIGPFGCRTPTRDRVLAARRGAGLPARRGARSPRTAAAARGFGQAVQAPVPAGAEHVLLVDDDGPIAIAEPREGAGLKPVVGFRSA